MAKHKIQKGLSDADMLKGFEEVETFETMVLRDEEPKKVRPLVQSKQESKDELYHEFLTEQIEKEIGKALLELQLDYMTCGYNGFSVEVKKKGKQIILDTTPKMNKK